MLYKKRRIITTRYSSLAIYIGFWVAIANFCMQNNLLAQAPIKKAETIIDTIFSKVWNEKREIRIFLPLEYFDNRDSLPVIYMMDGQSPEMFSYCTGLVDYLIAANQVRPMIVVGISSYDRVYELTPTPNGPANNYPEKQKFGGIEKTVEFIKNEIIPYISDHYRTTAQRILLGHSLGATAATYILLKDSLFNGFVLASPNYEFDNAWMIKKLEETIQKRKRLNNFLYLGYGLNDQIETKFYPAIIKFDQILTKAKPKELAYSAKLSKHQTHATTPLESFPSGLIAYEKFMKLSDKAFLNLYSADRNTILLSIQKYYRDKSTWSGFTVIPSADELNAWGYHCLENEDDRNAIKIFEWAISLYPDNYNLYDSNGEALMKRDRSKAISYFNKALSILNKYKNDMSVEDYEYYQKVFNDHLKKAESEKPEKSRN